MPFNYIFKTLGRYKVRFQKGNKTIKNKLQLIVGVSVLGMYSASALAFTFANASTNDLSGMDTSDTTANFIFHSQDGTTPTPNTSSGTGTSTVLSYQVEDAGVTDTGAANNDLSVFGAAAPFNAGYSGFEDFFTVAEVQNTADGLGSCGPDELAFASGCAGGTVTFGDAPPGVATWLGEDYLAFQMAEDSWFSSITVQFNGSQAQSVDFWVGDSANISDPNFKPSELDFATVAATAQLGGDTGITPQGVVDLGDRLGDILLVRYSDSNPTGTKSSFMYVQGLEVIVPVPAAVWLFGTGLVGLVALGRRKS